MIFRQMHYEEICYFFRNYTVACFKFFGKICLILPRTLPVTWRVFFIIYLWKIPIIYKHLVGNFILFSPIWLCNALEFLLQDSVQADIDCRPSRKFFNIFSSSNGDNGLPTHYYYIFSRIINSRARRFLVETTCWICFNFGK